MLLSFLRACKFALLNFWRNIWLSVVTIIILLLTLFSVTFSAGLNLVAKEAISLVKSRIDVSVYFVETALDEDVQHIAAELSALPTVKNVAYISREEALASFRERNKNNPVVQETLNVLGANPFGATLVVQAKQIEDFPTILALLDKPDYQPLIQDKDFEENQQVINRLTAITDRLSNVGYGISVLFAIIAALVIFNTIRITIYTYREEIGIMKLVGASNWFVRAPFVIESVLYALIAALLTLALLIPLIGFAAPGLNYFFAGYDFNVAQYFQNHLWSLFGLEIAVGVFLAVMSSMVAISRYLRR